MKVLKLCDVMVANSVMHNSSSFVSIVVTFLNSTWPSRLRSILYSKKNNFRDSGLGTLNLDTAIFLTRFRNLKP